MRVHQSLYIKLFRFTPQAKYRDDMSIIVRSSNLTPSLLASYDLRLFPKANFASAAVAVKGLRFRFEELRELRPLTGILASALG